MTPTENVPACVDRVRKQAHIPVGTAVSVSAVPRLLLYGAGGAHREGEGGERIRRNARQIFCMLYF